MPFNNALANYSEAPIQELNNIKRSVAALQQLQSPLLPVDYYEDILNCNSYFRGLSNNIPYVFHDKLLEQMGRKPMNNGKYRALVFTPYLYVQILNIYQGAPSTSGETLVTFDEAQNIAPAELKLIKDVNNGKVTINMFGDVRQHIEGTKGVDSWDEFKGIIRFKKYSLRENYRNARQITNYCNKRFRMKMQAINLNGSGVSSYETEGDFYSGLDTILSKADKSGLCAIIVGTNLEAAYIKYNFSDYEYRINDMTGDDVTVNPAKWNLLTISQAKGLEFATVIAVSGRMTENEKYICYTRALDNSYTGKGERILEDFLLPVMNIATNYDRITGFYSIESLLAISQGIESIYKRNGKMRLLVGIHSVPEDIIDAALYADRYREQIEKIRKEIIEDILSLTDAFQKRRLATLAWMIEDGLLEIRAAAIDGPGIFHPKTLIFNDENGDSIAAIGSPNETPYGLGGNFEQVVVIKSWENDGAVQDQSAFFDDLWNDRFDGVSVFEISKETADMIRDSLGKSYCKPEKQSLLSGCIKSNNIIAEAAQMPANFFVSGDIPALYMHQERAVISGLSRWPVRVLYADEVGLGKTFEAASTIVFLTKYCNVKRVVILTPKSVLQQWQDELEEHFGLSVWLYDSVVKEYISSDKKKRISIRGSNPIGPIVRVHES